MRKMFRPTILCGVFAALFLVNAFMVSTATAASSLGDLWNGAAELGDAELVNFTGNPYGHALEEMGRVSLVNMDNQTIYAYFRQLIPPENNTFEIYLGISSDGGKTFTMQPYPMISPGPVAGLGTINTVYDPDVIRLSDGFYMVFEGTGAGCAFSSYIAYSEDGIDNWQIKGVSVCSTTWTKSASTPNFVQTPDGGLYINWVEVVDTANITTRHQAKFNQTNLFQTISSDVDSGQMPQSPTGSWDDKNFGSGNVMYVDGYYYLFFEGAPFHRCLGRWGIGLAKTANISDCNSWLKHPDNPLILSPINSSCWIGYPEILKTGVDYYLYYSDALPYWQPAPYQTKGLFRRKIQEKREGNHAQYVAQIINSTMSAGQDYSASVTMKNTGTTNWTEAGLYRLGSQSPQDNTIWRDGRVKLGSSESVGAYCSTWDYVESLGGSLKSEPSVQLLESRLIIVAQGADDGVWAKEWMPGVGTVVDWYQVNGGMTNARPKLFIEKGILWLYVNGTDGQTYKTQWRWHGLWDQWTNLGAYDYGAAGPDYAAGYRVYRQGSALAIGTCTDAGSTRTFSFNVTAPVSPGSYAFQWRMVQDTVEWFGEYTPMVDISVVPTTTTTSTTTSSTSSTMSTSTSSTSTTSTTQQCNMPGNYPPCGETSLSEVVAAINQWAQASIGLDAVVDLINSWADSVTYPPN